MKIAIDIGHVNRSGATGLYGLEEHETASIIATSLRLLLRKAGHIANIFDFPTLGNDEELVRVAKAINEGYYDLSISLHFDSATSQSAHGAHVCYISERGKVAAQCVADHLCALLPGRAEKLQHRPGLYILKHTVPPAILCECGFGTSPKDAELLTRQPDAIARAIAMGVADYTRTLSQP